MFIAAFLPFYDYSQVIENEQKCEEAASMTLNESIKEQQMYECGRQLIGQNQDYLANILVIVGIVLASSGGALYALNAKPSWFDLSSQRR